jgi:energy-coupling factor transporter ATP-binding protein EcfA2
MSLESHPRWLRDIIRYVPLKSQFLLYGNVHDLYATPAGNGKALILPLIPYIAAALHPIGIMHALSYDPVRHFTLPPVPGTDPAASQQLLSRFGVSPSAAATASSQAQPPDLVTVLTQLAACPEAVATFVTFSSRLLMRPDHLTEDEHTTFTRAFVHGHTAQPRVTPASKQPVYNPVFWVVEKEGDLPDWFTVNNPSLRPIAIPAPDHIQRRGVCVTLADRLATPEQPAGELRERHIKAFVDTTEGLLTRDLAAIAQLCRSEALTLSGIEEGVRRYKLGVTEDPWKRLDRDKIRNADAMIRGYVKGQAHAITHMLDILKRAVTGFSVERSGRRPRGIAFLAGPTGVGKTELAKTITRLIFGDETAYIRFDMSEFSAEHSDQRLIGAPPGYVGYDVGGELTNAIRQKPFSVVLFDEIEKAHPRILDKFLQILDDGVLTSGRGERVYFSEAFIIFTSNLGILRMEHGERVQNVKPDMPFSDIERLVRAEIDRHFKHTIGRPELLNRIGENIIVFDFIRDDVAREILHAMVDRIIAAAEADNGYRIVLTPPAFADLEALCLADLSNGGRGIRNKLEAHFINPLARTLFDAAAPAGASLEIRRVTHDRTSSLDYRIS